MHIIASNMSSAANRTAVRLENKLIQKIDNQRIVIAGKSTDTVAHTDGVARKPLFDRRAVVATKHVVNPAYEMYRSSRMSKEAFVAAYPVCAKQAGL